MEDHLRAIDAEAWPSVATVPQPRFASWRAQRAEAAFAKACAAAELVLEGADADLTVAHDALFHRLAAHGWIGFAESYLAGEWTTPDSAHLVKVLSALIATGYAPNTPDVPRQDVAGGELPPDLVRLYAGDRVSHQGGVYSTGVPTTVRHAIEAHEKRGKTHFVDITTLSEPTAVDREDLADAQVRAAQWLADAAQVGPGTHVLVYPASGVQAAVVSAGRRGVVDLLSADAEALRDVAEYLVFAGATDAVACHIVPQPLPGPKHWRGHYDAIISVEALESFPQADRVRYARMIERLLDGDGTAVIQTTVATESMSPAARGAVRGLQAFIWPGLDYPSTQDVHKLLDKHTGLRAVAQTHTGSHYRESLAQQRSFFAGHLREAAAAGYDPVYRRLWMYQFALREALFASNMLDSVAFSVVHRHRRGRR
ncbi:class I SAM-dependent methyltransferase [Corynebacterium lizhenjunii]|uniref:class I SAM-dependent methyltransferase n=1 Tax=Corynebacterium lizhenjunii TaxID=2709394 RepID=UPI001F2C950F|nr:class I SAM-dependent methyltransferase [Corynebacterium lizhenjunii]